MDNPFQSPTVLSVCTGSRGLERGLDRALRRLNWGTSTSAVILEIEAFIIENLVQQMEQGVLAPAPVWSNLKTFNALPFRNKFAGLVGGYPCTPFSLAGLQQGTDDPRHLWPFIAGIIRTDRPVWCFFENVANHLNIGYETVRSELQDMGYHVEEGIYSAAEAGASQQRERLFILAILADSDVRGKQQWKHAGVGRIEELDTYWPAQPGEPQHGWEHPRVIEDETKPCMGCTVNGYDFREDLLRMCGNAVVEQCAEIAFLDLLYKHFNN